MTLPAEQDPTLVLSSLLAEIRAGVKDADAVNASGFSIGLTLPFAKTFLTLFDRVPE